MTDSSEVNVEEEVRQFIVDELGWPGGPEDLAADTPLLETEAIDSLGMYQLATWIEERYLVQLATEEFVPRHFGTIAAIADLVRSKRAAGAGRG